MTRRRPAAPPRSLYGRTLWTLLAIGVVGIPLFMAPSGDDQFRLPKLLLFRAVCILLIAATAVLWDGHAASFRDVWRRPAARLAIAIVGWSLVAATFATHRTTTIYSVINIVCGAVFFLAVLYAAPGRERSGVTLFLAPAIVNAVVFLLQSSTPWRAFFTRTDEHMAKTALLGNPNDVGTFLVAPAIVAMGFALSETGRRRAAFIATAVLIVLALLTTQALTAIASLCAGALTIYLQFQRKRSLLFAIGALVVAIGIVAVYPPSRARVNRAAHHAQAGEWNTMLSGRLSAYLPAWGMFLDHPITGVGPGCFAPNYFEYRLRADVEYPSLTYWTPGLGVAPNFGETHSDHLQVLAEMGVVGYGLFAAGFVLLLRRRANVRVAALAKVRVPLAVAIATLALGEFPFQTAATSMPLLFLIGICEAATDSGEP